MAAQQAREPAELGLDDAQIAEERCRTLAPLGRDEGIGWQELNLIVNDIMDNYIAGQYVGGVVDTRLASGLERAAERLMEAKALPLKASTPHELMRGLEVHNLIDLGLFMAAAYCSPALTEGTDQWVLGSWGENGYRFRTQSKR
jgi:hypothetical protein